MELRTSAFLKKNAVNRISETWGEVTAVVFIKFSYFLLYLLSMTGTFAAAVGFDNLFSENSDKPADISFVKVIVSLLIVHFIFYVMKIPFDYGVSWYLMQDAKGNYVQARSLFTCYSTPKRLFDTIIIEFLVTIQKFMYLIPFVLTFLAEFVLWDIILRRNSSSFLYNLSIVFLMLTVCCLTIAYLILTLKFSLVKFLFASDPDCSMREIIKKSKQTVSGREAYLIEIILSMVKWLIPCVLIFPAMFIVPYMMLVFSGAANEIIESYYADICDKNHYVPKRAKIPEYDL